jgi:hypothetical protein
MDELILYRSDYKGNNITYPELFWKSGLLSKQLNNADPKALEKYGWIKTIKSHIKPEEQLEAFLSETTPYLSFTSCSEIAKKKYLKGKENRQYNPTKFIKKADGFIFCLKIKKNDLKEIKEIGEGVYCYKYLCNRKKHLHFTNEFENPDTCLINFIPKCLFCNNIVNFHHIILIDCVKYLKSQILKKGLENSLSCAIEDAEWLVISIDPFENGGKTSIIPPADFWDCSLYEKI